MHADVSSPPLELHGTCQIQHGESHHMGPLISGCAWWWGCKDGIGRDPGAPHLALCWHPTPTSFPEAAACPCTVANGTQSRLWLTPNASTSWLPRLSVATCPPLSGTRALSISSASPRIPSSLPQKPFHQATPALPAPLSLRLSQPSHTCAGKKRAARGHPQVHSRVSALPWVAPGQSLPSPTETSGPWFLPLPLTRARDLFCRCLKVLAVFINTEGIPPVMKGTAQI